MKTPQDVLNYLEKTSHLSTFFKHPPLNVEEIGDGNLNFIFRVRDQSGASLILKYAAPYLRLLGEDFPLPQNRICVEMHTLEYFKKIAPTLIPTLYHCDEASFCFFMEDLLEYQLLQTFGLTQSAPLSIYEKLGSFLATLYTKVPPKHKEIGYYENETLKSISEHYIFIYPHSENHPALVIPEHFSPLPKSALFHKNIEHLLYLFRFEKECLIHGDLHTGSIMIKRENLAIIDAEFSFFGPLGFDIGTLLAHLIFADIYHCFEQKPRQFSTIVHTLWKAFERGLGDVPIAILQQSIGFCGAELSRRLVVPAKAKPLEAIHLLESKAKAYACCEKLSIALIERCFELKSMEEFIAIVESHVCAKTH